MKRDEIKGCYWFTLENINPNKEYVFQYFLGAKKDHLFIVGTYSEKTLDPAKDEFISPFTYPNFKKISGRISENSISASN